MTWRHRLALLAAAACVLSACADYDAGQPDPPWVITSAGGSFSGATPSTGPAAPLTHVDTWQPSAADVGASADAGGTDAGPGPAADVIWWDAGQDAGQVAEPDAGADAGGSPADAAVADSETDTQDAAQDAVDDSQPAADVIAQADVGTADAGAADAGAADAGAADAGGHDGGAVDGGGGFDVGPSDTGSGFDVGPADAGAPDAGLADAGADVGDAAWDPDWLGYGDVSFPDGSDIHGGVLDSCWSLYGIVFEETCTNADLTVACIDSESALGSIYAQYLFEPLRKCVVANCVPKCTGAGSKDCLEQCRAKNCAYPLFACASEGVSGTKGCPETFACMQQYENKFFSMAFHCFGKASPTAKKQLAEFFACGTEPQTDSCFDQIAACYGPAGNATCGETIQCSENCPQDDGVCGFECIGKADADGQNKLDLLWDCIIAKCDNQPDSCIGQKCPLEVADCLNDK